MSQYIPTQWKNGQSPYINAFNLNHMEAGIESVHKELDDVVGGTTPVANATRAQSAATVDKATQTHIGGAKIWVDDSDPANPIGYIDAR